MSARKKKEKGRQASGKQGSTQDNSQLYPHVCHSADRFRPQRLNIEAFVKEV